MTITGNGSVGQSYVLLGDGSTNILPTTNSPYTIQLWATQNGLQSWSRIWDFGNVPGTNNLVWSWTQGTSAPGVFAVNGANNNTVGFNTGTQYNMTLTATPGAAAVERRMTGTSILPPAIWSAPAALPPLGIFRK